MWVFEAKFVHDPSGFGPIRSPIFVKNQSFPHPNDRFSPGIEHRPIFPGRLPIAGGGGAVGSKPGRVLPVSEAKEVPFVRVQLGHVCNIYNRSCSLA